MKVKPRKKIKRWLFAGTLPEELNLKLKEALKVVEPKREFPTLNRQQRESVKGFLDLKL